MFWKQNEVGLETEDVLSLTVEQDGIRGCSQPVLLAMEPCCWASSLEGLQLRATNIGHPIKK